MKETLLDLWRTDAPAVEKYARRALKDRHAAEDIAAQAITQLGEALERGAEVRSPAAFLWRVALNLVVDEVKRRDREVPAGDRAAMEDRLEQGEQHAVGDGLHLYRPLPLALADFPPEFDRAVRELPEHERDAFILTELRGLTTREAGAVLDVSNATVSRRSGTARKRVRGLLAA